MNLEELDIYEWEKKYIPIIDEDTEQERHFHWAGKDEKDLYAELDKLDKDNRFLHVWTLMTDDNGDMCICNGWHMVNRMDYIVTEVPWGTPDNFKDVDIYVDYLGDAKDFNSEFE